MRITAGTLFLAFAVFLDHVEFIRCVEPVQTSLAELFPEYERYGYLPRARVLTNPAITRTTAFLQIGNHTLIRPMMTPNHEAPFLARAHVIFAWRGDARSDDNDRMEDYIEPLWLLFQGLIHPKLWVFDTFRDHWVTLNQKEFDKLGFGFMLTLIAVQEQTARQHRLRHRNPVVDARAHHTAYLRANEAINMLQVTEAKKIRSGQTSVADSVKLIRKRYVEAYDIVFCDIAREAAMFN